MNRRCRLIVAMAVLLPVAAKAQRGVPTAAPAQGKGQSFRDARYGVRFQVPAGWDLTHKDGQFSTFRLDARSAVRRSEMRAVASLDFNPFPLSTLSGATFYYSVEPHATDRECERQATNFPVTDAHSIERRGEGNKAGLHNRDQVESQAERQNIGGMDFVHGHDEHGKICIEARDDIYTAFRKGSCYRFDLAVNTFCSVTSGAEDLTADQIRSIEERMTAILSSVALDWEKAGPQPVPVPAMTSPAEPKPAAQPEPDSAPAKVAAGMASGSKVR